MIKLRNKWYMVVAVMLICMILMKFYPRHHEERQAVVVAVRAAKFYPVSPTISVIGDVIAEFGVEVSSKVNGIIKTIYFESGSNVKKDDLLVELWNDDIKAMLDQSVAKFNLAKQEYDRYSLLMKGGTVSGSDYDKVVSQLASAQADVNYQTALLNQTHIRAPFAGRTGIKNINIGQYISPGQSLVDLQAIAPLYVNFNIPEQYANQVKIGREVHLVNDAAPGVSITGKVVALGSSLSLDTRTRPVRAIITNNAEQLTPGMYVQVNLALTNPRNAILIPQSAIVYSPIGSYVFVVAKHQTQQVKVELGEEVGDDVVVSKGLAQGDVVVCAGQIKLHPGVIVKAKSY